MLIFNCTEAASKFFSRVHKGKTITPVEAQPPSPTPEEDELGDSAEQWLVHVISAATAARASVRLRRVEKGASPHRLPRRSRRPLLLGAVPTLSLIHI